MPTAPRRLGPEGRRLWKAVHGRYRLSIPEGVLLAHACDLADALARAHSEAPPRPRVGCAGPPHPDLDPFRGRLATVLAELDLPPDLIADFTGPKHPVQRPGRHLKPGLGGSGTKAASPAKVKPWTPPPPLTPAPPSTRSGARRSLAPLP